MFEQLSQEERTIAIQRLTALWALNECGLGGILHAFQSPFTGLIVGSIAMTCIAFICSIAQHKWKSTMGALAVVLIIKALVSPHSSPTAYIAVTFQAVSGAIIYRYIPSLLIGSVLFVTVGLVESAIQRILTLTILYGNTLWNAINMWGEWVIKKWKLILPFTSSQLIVLTYLSIHIIAGILIGLLVYKTIWRSHQLWGDAKFKLELTPLDKKSFRSTAKKKPGYRKLVLVFILLLMVMISYTFRASEGWQTGLIILVRVITILLLWFLFIAPVLIGFLRKYLQRKQHQMAVDVSRTMDLLPQIAWIIDKSWKEAKQLPFASRWKTFILSTILYTLQFKSTHDPHIDRPHTES